jgi:hypothetical protein
VRLHISKDFSLPLDAVTQTFAILAKRRVGKTYLASVMAEEFVAANLPFAALDPTGAWWGLGSGKDGKAEGGLSVYVIGGAHGIPLEPTAGKIIAEQIATYPSFYIIDVSQFDSNAAQDRFAMDFAERLYRIKEKHREPLHLFIDEADAFVPQRPMPGQQRMLGAFEALVRRGGLRGIGVTLISQRPAVVNKNVLEQTECIIALQTTGPNDQDAIDNWVKRNGTPQERETLMSSLASLQKGEAWIYSPAWLEVFKKVHIRERKTFNSSATPRVGEKQTINPAMVEGDLNRLSEQIKATIEKAKENDPEALKRRIRELERQIKTSPEPTMSHATIQGIVEKGREEARRELVPKIEYLEQVLKQHQKRMADAAYMLTGKQIENPLLLKTNQPLAQRGPNISVGQRRAAPLPPPKRESILEEGEIKLRAGARRMLAALVQWYPTWMNEGQMLAHAGLKGKKSGTASAYKTDLRMAGVAEQDGKIWRATQAGIDWLGHDIPAPSTTQEVLNIWLPKLRAGARRMLEILVQRGGEPISDEQLQDEADLHIGGTYSAYKTDLRTARLIVTENGMVAANKETLFL